MDDLRCFDDFEDDFLLESRCLDLEIGCDGVWGRDDVLLFTLSLEEVTVCERRRDFLLCLTGVSCDMVTTLFLSKTALKCLVRTFSDYMMSITK